MNESEFINFVKEMNIELNTQMITNLKKYYETLIEWNEKINLTRIIEKDQVYLKHFYDSLTLRKVYDLTQNLTLCDIGTGAGFPGLVLKIVFPNLKVTLVDSLNKRTKFLDIVVQKLKLDQVFIITARAEEFAKKNRESFDIVTTRAVSNIGIMSEICTPLLKKQGYFFVMKGFFEEDIPKLEKTLKKLGCKLEKIEKFELPIENSKRSILKIKKINPTPPKYPRNFSQIKKNSL